MGLKATAVGRLRDSRAAWTLHNLLHYRELRRNSEHYRRLGIRKSVVSPIAHRDLARAGEEAQVPWLDRPDARQALHAHPDFERFEEPLRRQLEGWIDDGLMILERHLDDAEVDELNREIQRLFDEGVVKYHPLAPRIVNGFEQSEAIRGLCEQPELLRLLSFTLGRDVDLFQTINFFLGSQQEAHSDSFHMTTEPFGYLIAIWVALEDVEPGSGPLFYYPGSHRLDYLMTEDLERGPEGKGARYSRRIARLIDERGLEPVDFHARKGDVLIWHANLIHGGHPIERQGTTRKSLVAHYFADGVFCYHEVSERPALIKAPS